MEKRRDLTNGLDKILPIFDLVYVAVDYAYDEKLDLLLQIDKLRRCGVQGQHCTYDMSINELKYELQLLQYKRYQWEKQELFTSCVMITADICHQIANIIEKRINKKL